MNLIKDLFRRMVFWNYPLLENIALFGMLALIAGVAFI
jgi:hypothetical protein